MTDTKRQSCCDEPSCPRADIVRFLSPDEPIEQDVDELAFVAAHSCPALDREGLEFCFTRAFEIPGECQLFDRFCTQYAVEREGLNLMRQDTGDRAEAEKFAADAAASFMQKAAGG